MPESCCGCADEDREQIQEETEKQEDTFDQIGSALGDLKHMSHVSHAAPLSDGLNKADWSTLAA